MKPRWLNGTSNKQNLDILKASIVMDLDEVSNEQFKPSVLDDIV